MAWNQPELFAALMDRLVKETSDYLIGQIRAGAEAVQLFDSWAGVVPASLFDTAVIRPTKAIVRAVKAASPSTPVIGFPRAAGSHLARYAAMTGVDAVGVDHMTDLGFAATAAGRPIQGNLDPALLLGGGPAMIGEARRIVERMAGKPFIFNLGHGVMPETPPGRVAELVQAVRGG
jgi:uroporphyrinogen decarboxylase